MEQPLINLMNISKSFDGTLVLDDLTLSVKENTFVTLLGPSGCGKTNSLDTSLVPAVLPLKTERIIPGLSPTFA